jgi:hypothetical protein
MPSLDEVLECKDGKQLTQWMAEIVFGWHIEVKDGLRTGEDRLEWYLDERYQCDVDSWNPTSDINLLWRIALGRDIEISFAKESVSFKSHHDNWIPLLRGEHGMFISDLVVKAIICNHLGKIIPCT